MKLLVGVFVVVALASGALAGRRGQGRRHRGCRRAAGEGVAEMGEGTRFMWTMSGLDDDDLRVTYKEGAFAPEGSTTVFKYPSDRGQRALGLVPAKVLFDYSTPEPMAVIRQGRRGRGACVLVDADVDTYDDLINMLLSRNVSNQQGPEREESLRLIATQATDDSQFSQVVRDVCSKDQCGRPIEAVYYTTEVMIDEEDDEGDDEKADEPDDTSLTFEPSYVLLNTRVTISGLPDPRLQRMQRRQHRRQNRRQHAGDTPGREDRRQRRKNRRQQRRMGERRGWGRQGRGEVQAGL